MGAHGRDSKQDLASIFLVLQNSIHRHPKRKLMMSASDNKTSSVAAQHVLPRNFSRKAQLLLRTQKPKANRGFTAGGRDHLYGTSALCFWGVELFAANLATLSLQAFVGSSSFGAFRKARIQKMKARAKGCIVGAPMLKDKLRVKGHICHCLRSPNVSEIRIETPCLYFLLQISAHTKLQASNPRKGLSTKQNTPE